jgi:hypothetical protein
MTKLSSWFAVGVLTAACAVPALAASGIEDMNGYWSGNGSVILSNGSTERVKCSVTYKVTDGGTQIRQSMRCASADYKIDALAELRVKGERVSGSWEEKTYSATGAVTGKFSDNNFVLSIQGANFSAAMHVSLSDCKQNISISPQGLDVTRISIGLGKC